ncbi:hypothetical protein EBB07_29370 [Paenibacillaceae bacterium]|nr:hypothetical protein EBB07_29370 [Paenibacillaceae bacterium]
MMNTIHEMIIERAASIVYDSYNSVFPEDAYVMAIGEAEIEFDTEFQFKFDERIKTKIIAKAVK